MTETPKKKGKAILCGSVDADLEERFRQRVGELHGSSKGAIGRVLQEMVEGWMAAHPKEE